MLDSPLAYTGKAVHKPETGLVDILLFFHRIRLGKRVLNHLRESDIVAREGLVRKTDIGPPRSRAEPTRNVLHLDFVGLVGTNELVVTFFAFTVIEKRVQGGDFRIGQHTDAAVTELFHGERRNVAHLNHRKRGHQVRRRAHR